MVEQWANWWVMQGVARVDKGFGVGVGVLVWVVGLTGCQEVPPPDLLIGSELYIRDSVFQVQSLPAAHQNVLVDEFTGVLCSNCVPAARYLQSLDSLYHPRMHILSIHSGAFARPYSGVSQYDFRTEASDALAQLLGFTGTLPVAAIQRRAWVNDQLLYEPAQWKTYIEQALQESPVAALEAIVLPEGQKLRIRVTATFLQDVAQPVYLALYFVEDSIVDAQLTPSGLDTFYVHRHVLRGSVGPASGMLLVKGATRGTAVLREVRNVRPPEWLVGQHRYLYCVLMGGSGASKTFLQVGVVRVP